MENPSIETYLGELACVSGREFAPGVTVERITTTDGVKIVLAFFPPDLPWQRYEVKGNTLVPVVEI